VRHAALLALLLGAPALAQDTPMEPVIVSGGSLEGVWHGALGQSGFRGLVGNLTGITPLKLGQTAVIYCRIAPLGKDLQMLCPQFGTMGWVTVGDGLVRIRSGSMTFEGWQPEANRLRGRFRSRTWLGISRESPATAEAVRVVLRADAPDAGGKASLLRRILEEGLASVPQDVEGLKRNGANLTLPRIGPIESLTYLGQEAKWDWPPPPGTKPDIMNLPHRPDFYSVYLVRWAEGELLCGLHQRDDDVLDGFACV
jgi:hypothetical protein